MMFAIETLTQNLVDEVSPILIRHYKELALDQDKVPLDPNWDLMMSADANGQTLTLVGRREGQIVAYFFGFVRPHLHYKTHLTLAMDVFYVLPEARGAHLGVQLFKAVQREAKQRGVQKIIVGSKLHKDASWLFERLGYKEIERFYSLWIGD